MGCFGKVSPLVRLWAVEFIFNSCFSPCRLHKNELSRYTMAVTDVVSATTSQWYKKKAQNDHFAVYLDASRVFVECLPNFALI